jgi:hypothetical protein
MKYQYIKQVRWADKDNPFQTGILSENAIKMSLYLREWAENADIGDKTELANSIYERIDDKFIA